MSEYKAEVKEIDGKKVLVIHPITIETINPDGTKSIIVKVPALHLITELQEKLNAQCESEETIQGEGRQSVVVRPKCIGMAGEVHGVN